MADKYRLITSALPYVNNIPHLGNIIGCVLSADVYARFCRSNAYETLFVCGTDEYGTATETKALQENLSPKEICDKYHAIHKNIYEAFNLSFDVFGRTSDEVHTMTVQEIFSSIEKYNPELIIEKESQQYFSVKLDKFLADRLIIGECPFCHYKQARGDQCDSCTKVLSPIDLINPNSAIDDSPIELRTTRHLYLDLPALSEVLTKWQAGSIELGHWTQNAKTMTQAWLKQGLEARAITRDLKWGIPVPKKGYENKVFYVWFDAPIGYISATRKLLPDSWKGWWKNPEQVNLYHFMAKDNIPFHSIIFPATQFASEYDDERWTKVFHISSTEYLNYENTKFSKSLGVGVFGDDVLASQIPIDLWRFYLLYIRPEKQDTAFLWDDFFQKVNKDFIDNIANLFNRATTFLFKNFSGSLFLSDLNTSQKNLWDDMLSFVRKIQSLLEQVKLRDALHEILALGRLGNKFFQEQEPWAKIKEEALEQEVQQDLSLVIVLVHLLSVPLEAYMPETAQKIQSLLASRTQWQDMNLNLNDEEVYRFLSSQYQSKTINPPELLFSKLDKKELEKIKKKFNSESRKDYWLDVKIQVGEIIEAQRHPNADKLYVLNINLGEGKRQIVSKLVDFYQEEDIINKKILVLVNLKSIELRGIESQGMVLTAENKAHTQLIFVDDDIQLGSTISRQEQKVVNKFPLISLEDFSKARLNILKFSLMQEKKPLILNGKNIKTQLVDNGKIH